MIPNISGNAENSRKSMTEFLQIMRRFDTLSISDLKDIITVGVFDTKERERLFRLLIDLDSRFGKPSDIPNMEIAIRAAVASSFHIAESTGGSTAIGSMVFSPDLTYDSWEDFNPKLLIKNFSEGTFARIHGPPRKGKTNIACNIIEEWVDKSHIALSNIWNKVNDNHYIYVKNARQLFENLPRKKKFILFYDEGVASGYGKPNATSVPSRYTDKLMRIIGKLYGNICYIEQKPESTPQVIQDWSTSNYFAIEHEPTGLIHLELISPKSFSKTFTDFPKSNIPFITRDIASFDMNVNVEKMFPLLTGVNNPYEVMLEFLERPESDPANRRKISKPQDKIDTSDLADLLQP